MNDEEYVLPNGLKAGDRAVYIDEHHNYLPCTIAGIKKNGPDFFCGIELGKGKGKAFHDWSHRLITPQHAMDTLMAIADHSLKMRTDIEQFASGS